MKESITTLEQHLTTKNFDFNIELDCNKYQWYMDRIKKLNDFIDDNMSNRNYILFLLEYIQYTNRLGSRRKIVSLQIIDNYKDLVIHTERTIEESMEDCW